VNEDIPSDSGLAEFAQLAGTKATTSEGYRENNVTLRPGSLQCYEVNEPAFFPVGKTITTLPAGQYNINLDKQRGPFFHKMTTNLDELLVLPDNSCDRVLQGIKTFWAREQHFRDHKFLWKRGIMLWGPPGSGKTSLIQLLSKEIISRDGLAIFCGDPHLMSTALAMLRLIEPVRPLVVFLEDIDAIVKDYGDSQLLALLDGEIQIDNVVYLATTNYPELLDKRLINRPCRFDEVIKIDMPSEDARAVYLSTKSNHLKANPEELHKWVKGTKGFSVAHLRELLVAVECLGNDYEAVMHRLKLMNKAKPTSEDKNKGEASFGFAPTEND
jgi:AAA+ superfamily predicted ATPase